MYPLVFVSFLNFLIYLTDLKPAVEASAVCEAVAEGAGSNAPQPLPLQVADPDPGKVSPSRYEAIASLDTEENEAEKWAGNSMTR